MSAPKFKVKNLFSIGFVFVFLLHISSAQAKERPLSQLKLPDGFHVEIYADNIPDARSMALSPHGILYVGNRSQSRVYALVDENLDYKVNHVYTIAEGLNMPNGVAWKEGSLYVAEVNRILRFDNIDRNLTNPPQPVILKDDLPTARHHGWKFIKFGPDNKLYIPVGAPCNICERKEDIYASIWRMNPDGSDFEQFAAGIRNTVGFDWDPQTNELWFTDNGRDMLGDDIPPDELNHAPQKGMHFGYPYCHGKNILDPEFGKKKSCSESTPAAQELGPHVAALGVQFYTGTMFPDEYRNRIFIAEHGSWNRSTKIGYRITMVTLKDNQPVNYNVFAEGWQQGENVWGRPVDLELLPDGSMLVSDDYAGVIYRITYQKK